MPRLEQTLTDDEDRRSSYFGDEVCSSAHSSGNLEVHAKIDSRSSLLDIHRQTKREYDNGAVLCIKHPPRWLWHIYRNRNLIFIFILTAIMVASAIGFALVHEEEEDLSLASVSQQYPLVQDVGSVSKGVLEALISIQAAEAGVFPDNSFLNVSVQGKNDNDAAWALVESLIIV